MGRGEITIFKILLSTGFLFVAFSVTKLTGNTDSSWFLVATPLWAGIPVMLAIKGLVSFLTRNH